MVQLCHGCFQLTIVKSLTVELGRCASSTFYDPVWAGSSTPLRGSVNKHCFLWQVWASVQFSSVTQSCLTVCTCLEGSSMQGILQARLLEWVAISFSRGYFQPRNWIWVSCIAGRFFTCWTIGEATSRPLWVLSHLSCAQLSVTPWTVACQAPPSMGFPRQEILEWVAIS